VESFVCANSQSNLFWNILGQEMCGVLCEGKLRVVSLEGGLRWKMDLRFWDYKLYAVFTSIGVTTNLCKIRIIGFFQFWLFKVHMCKPFVQEPWGLLECVIHSPNGLAWLVSLWTSRWKWFMAKSWTKDYLTECRFCIKRFCFPKELIFEITW
jgi:hypothetical protein